MFGFDQAGRDEVPEEVKVECHQISSRKCEIGDFQAVISYDNGKPRRVKLNHPRARHSRFVSYTVPSFKLEEVRDVARLLDKVADIIEGECCND